MFFSPFGGVYYLQKAEWEIRILFYMRPGIEQIPLLREVLWYLELQPFVMINDDFYSYELWELN